MISRSWAAERSLVMMTRSAIAAPLFRASCQRPGGLRFLSRLLLLDARALRDCLGQPVEVLGGAAHLALPDQFDQSRFRQLGDVVVGIAERDLQLAAEITGGEDPAAVDPEDFQDRDPPGMRGRPCQPLPVDGKGRTAVAVVPIFRLFCGGTAVL